MTLQVYPRLTPRIVKVLSSLDEITMQQLVNQLRDWEDEPSSMSYQKLVTASGKQNLGGGVTVGITVQLENAKLMFESRTTHISSGVTTSNDATGTVLIATGTTFITDGVEAGATIINFTDQSVATVMSIDSETQITHEPLDDGILNQWTIGDVYKIWNIIQCDASGGNLTAVDSNGVTMSPLLPSAFTQIVKTSSSSATLQELDAIQYSSYQNAVWIDAVNGSPGTEYPIGTPESPVDNIVDAKSIAVTKGFNKIIIIGTLTINTGVDLTGLIIEGINKLTCFAVVEPAAIVVDTFWYNLTITGTLDHNSFMKECILENLTYSEGDIHGCELYGTIVMGGTEGVEIWNSYSGRKGPTDSPIIDMNNLNVNCAIHNFTGHIQIRNMTQGIIGLHGYGRVTIESTVSGGMVHILGNFKVSNNATGTASIRQNYNVTPLSIADAIWDESTSGHITSGTFGEKIGKKLLSLGQFLGLK